MKIIKTEIVNIEDIIINDGIYPREKPSEVRIGEYLSSYKAGAKFPPVIVDIKTKQLIDGRHRYDMYRKAGAQQIEVEWREFENEKELIWYAINLNSTHGLKLTTFDQARCIIMGESAGMTEEELSSAMVITKSRFETIRVNRIRNVEVGTIQGPDKKDIPKFESVAVKRIISEATEDTVNTAQLAAQKSMGCMRALVYIKESIHILKLNLLQFSDVNADFVKQLNEACMEWLESHPVNKSA